MLVGGCRTGVEMGFLEKNGRPLAAGPGPARVSLGLGWNGSALCSDTLWSSVVLTLFLRESAFLSPWYGWLSSHHIIILIGCVWQNYFNSFFCWWSKSLIFSSQKKFACMYSWRHPPPLLWETVGLTLSLLLLFLPWKCPALFKNTCQSISGYTDAFDRCLAFGRDCERVGLMFFQYSCLTLRGPDRYIPLGNLE